MIILGIDPGLAIVGWGVLESVKGIAFVEMDEKDIVRHKLVTRIVNAYHKYESANKYPLFNENRQRTTESGQQTTA